MSGATEDTGRLQRALAAIRGLRSELEATREPIAIVGASCRFPGGASDLEGYWRLVRAGRDAVGEIPPDRFDADLFFDPDPDAPGKMAVRRGGFIEGIDRFDAAFFGISPREAESMDPQQRLLLELAWEALEDAAIAPDGLLGSRTGVFVGICGRDYEARVLAPEAAGPYSITGSLTGVAAGRIAYALGLRGPALAVDTACSSSLVAVHLACRAIRAGECDAALAGGVSLIIAPGPFVGFSKLRALSRSGVCRPFDAAADGYVRGEGAGLVVLKRLSQARADNDRVIAVIRGSAANQDGRSNGLTAPSGPAQEDVIRRALADAGVAPARVGYVECHGTGTALGDPIEVRALAAVLGPGRPAGARVLIGSAKANLGHLEAAAGIAGLLRAALAVERGEVPPTPHFETPNPHIPWEEIPLEVAAATGVRLSVV
jgi:acyl transferase domain-containing protein